MFFDSRRRIRLTRVGLALVSAVLSVSAAGAGVFEQAIITGDDDCGIRSSVEYTHAVNIAGPATRVNGVDFVGTSGPTPSGENFSTVGFTGYFPNWGGSTATGSLKGILDHFNYDGDPQGLTLTGLTPGQNYKATFYNCPWGDAGLRYAAFQTDDGGYVEFDENFSNDGTTVRCNRLTYSYTAQADSLTFSIIPFSQDYTFHLYAFTNEVVDQRELLFSDTFRTDGASPLRSDVNYGYQSTDPARQEGSLGYIPWSVRPGTQSQLGNICLKDGNVAMMTFGSALSPDRNFSGSASSAGLDLEFELAPDALGTRSASAKAAVSLGLSQADRFAAPGTASQGLSILFGGDGAFEVFDGTTSVGSGTAWTSEAGAEHRIRLLLTDTDGNPFDGSGSTTVELRVDGDTAFNYTKTGGYSDNYISFYGSRLASVDSVSLYTLDGAAAVPEPAVLGLLAGGLAGLLLFRRRGVSRLACFAIAAAFVVFVGTSVTNAGDLPLGTAIIDGDLSDWADAQWMPLDAVYYGEPSDVSEAKFAARWTPHMIYVAVTVVDTDHVFQEAFSVWNGQDSLEIYVDPANRNTVDFNATYADAQGFMISTTPSGESSWICLGGTPLASDQTAVPDFAISVDGDVINYEIALRPYDAFDRNDPSASTELVLADGMTIGLDFTLDTKYATGFGMLSTTASGGKYHLAELFSDHLLTGGADLRFSDGFSVLEPTEDVNVAVADRQGGALAGLTYSSTPGTFTGLHAVELGQDAAFAITATVLQGVLSPDTSFSGSHSEGGLSIRFDASPDVVGLIEPEETPSVAFSCGLSEADRFSAAGEAVAQLGISLGADGTFKAYDSGTEFLSAELFEGDGSVLNHHFELRFVDPTDGNPFDGVGQTDLEILVDGVSLATYRKASGGYSSNYLNWQSNLLASVDNVLITPFDGEIVIESSAVPGDLNADGVVNSGDLDIVRANWGQSVPVGDLASGDPSQDGLVGSADLDIVRANWGATAAASAVPEPGAWVCLGLAGIAGLALRSRKR